MKRLSIKVIKKGKSIKDISKEYACCRKTQRMGMIAK